MAIVTVAERRARELARLTTAVTTVDEGARRLRPVQ